MHRRDDASRLVERDRDVRCVHHANALSVDTNVARAWIYSIAWFCLNPIDCDNAAGDQIVRGASGCHSGLGQIPVDADQLLRDKADVVVARLARGVEHADDRLPTSIGVGHKRHVRKIHAVFSKIADYFAYVRVQPRIRCAMFVDPDIVRIRYFDKNSGDWRRGVVHDAFDAGPALGEPYLETWRWEALLNDAWNRGRQAKSKKAGLARRVHRSHDAPVLRLRSGFDNNAIHRAVILLIVGRKATI